MLFLHIGGGFDGRKIVEPFEREDSFESAKPLYEPKSYNEEDGRYMEEASGKRLF